MFGTYQRLGLPVTATDREVIRATMAKLQPKHRFSRYARVARHNIYREMLEYHHGAQRLYRKVMTGDFS